MLRGTTVESLTVVVVVPSLTVVHTGVEGSGGVVPSVTVVDS